MELFELVETVDNDIYTVKVFESSYYNLNVVRNKEFEYKRIELSKNGNQSFVPQLYVGSEDEDFKIEIQTTSYGALIEQEFICFLERQQKVLEYIKEVKYLIENE